MPELPEVETVRRGLAPALEGRTVTRVDILDPRLVQRSPRDPAAAMTGASVVALRRRGKWLLADLDNDLCAVLHLRMSGQLLVGPPADGETRRPRLVLELSDGGTVRFVDQRRFGELLVYEPAETAALEARLGPDADTATVRDVRRALAGRSGRVKAAILDQRRLAGIGNMYADEALWRARVDPDRIAGSLDEAELRRLAKAIRDVLRDALAAGGTTTKDGLYVGTDGTSGYFDVELAVYQREGKPCPRCGTEVERITHGASATRRCPRCQR